MTTSPLGFATKDYVPPDRFATLPQQRYCLGCNERLWDAGPGNCHACGRGYDGRDGATFRFTPRYDRWRFWFPGLSLAIISGVLSYAVCLQSGELGFALFVAVPLSVGAILGYASRVVGWLLATLGLVALASIVMALVSLHWAGFFCGMTLGIIFLAPLYLGILLGWILRMILAGSRWDQHWFLPLLLIASLPYLVQVIENSVPMRRELSTVRTELTVDATPQEAYRAVIFYEEVRHTPPWLLRLGLPRPLRSEGDKSEVGQIVRCVYDRGYLVKRISERVENRRLAFEVIEQQLHFERDVQLTGGSFDILPLGNGRTKILLTTHYRRMLRPGWIWRPLEHQVVHTLHEHVLEGMRRELTSERPPHLEPAQETPYVPRDAPYRLPAIARVESQAALHGATAQ